MIRTRVREHMRKNHFAFFFTVLLLIGTGCLSMGRFKTQSTAASITLGNTASINPLLPDPLLDDASVPEWYAAVRDYYYITENASPSYYHVIWTHPIDPGDNFDVFLYLDPGYTTPVAGGDWVIVRPATNQKLYPTVHTYSDAGDAYTEWEATDHLLVIDDVVDGTLNDSEYLETYQVSLTAGYWYNLSLAVPPGADFAIYVYYLTSGQAVDPTMYAEMADDAGTDGDERIFWEASKTGPHAVILRGRSGAGPYTLEFRSPAWQYNGGAGNSWVLYVIVPGVVAAGVVLVTRLRLRRRSHRPTPDAPKGGKKLGGTRRGKPLRNLRSFRE